MPVKGLMPGLMEVGKIKIGIKGDMVKSKDGNEFRLPQKIDHFRIVKNDRNDQDDYVLDDQIIEIIKENPASILDKDGNIIGIPIRLLYNEIDLVFPTKYVSYVAGKLSCSGNGEKAHTRDGRETKCPCARLDGAYQGKDKCKISGTLSCIIEGSNVGGCYKFRTTSINSARYILSSLMLIKAATGGLLSFIPLRLVINPKKTIIPTTGAPTTIYVVTVEYQGGIDDLQVKALKMGQERVSLIENMRSIELEAKKIVSMDNSDDDDHEEREFVEEFFPDAIEVKTEKEPAATDEKEKPKKAEKSKDSKKNKPEKKAVVVDDLLGQPTEKVDKQQPGRKSEMAGTGSETNGPDGTDHDEVSKKILNPPAGEPITRDQLKIILGLKNKLKINDPAEWTALIEQMKFDGVTKANGMTSAQGDLFIGRLKAMNDDPF